MNQLMPSQLGVARQTHVSRELAEHLQRTGIAVDVAKYGMEELSLLYINSERTTMDAMIVTNFYRRAFEQGGGSLSEEEAATLTALRKEYLEAVEHIMQLATHQIVRDIANTPATLTRRSFWG